MTIEIRTHGHIDMPCAMEYVTITMQQAPRDPAGCAYMQFDNPGHKVLVSCEHKEHDVYSVYRIEKGEDTNAPI